MPARQNRLFLAAQLVLAAVVLWFVCRALVAQWNAYRGAPVAAHPVWGWVLLSGAIYLLTYAVLVQTWRAMLAAWDAHLRFWDATAIWCVSSLARYVPGKIWQIGAMGVMAEQRDVPAMAAAGTAILNTVVNIAVGIAVALATGWTVLVALAAHYAIGAPAVIGASVALIAAAALAILSLPALLPRMLRLAERLTGRRFALGPLPMRAVAYAVIGNIIAWFLYGVAFEVLVYGVAGAAPGTTAQYTALYSSSYILGYLFLVIPGGLGIRDSALAAGLGALHLAAPPAALAIVVTSRIWLTILEVVPGLLFLAWGSSRRTRTRDIGNLPT